MSDSFCSKCDQYNGYKPEFHKCPPLFEVLIKDYHGDDDGMQVNAYDAEEAAEKAIEDWDAEGDYTCIGGEEINVTVKSSDGSVKKFVVTGESCPSYHATEVDE